MISLIPLYLKGEVIAYAFVDEEDEWVTVHKWRLSDSGYAMRQTSKDGVRGYIYLHKLIMGNPDSQVDHINRNKLDNRRSNLRAATNALNGQNQGSRSGSSSKYRNVTWHKNDKKWQVIVAIDGKNHYLGQYSDEDEAGRVAADFRAKNMPYSEDYMGLGVKK